MNRTELPSTNDVIAVPSNAHLSMNVTLLGIDSTPDRRAQNWNAFGPTCRTSEPSSKLLIPVCRNAELLTYVTLGGIVSKPDRAAHSTKALSPILDIVGLNEIHPEQQDTEGVVFDMHAVVVALQPNKLEELGELLVRELLGDEVPKIPIQVRRLAP